MKKYVYLFVLLTCFAVLTGCGNTSKESSSDIPTTTTNTTITTRTTTKEVDYTQYNKYLLFDGEGIRWDMSEKELIDIKRPDKNYNEYSDKSGKVVEYYYRNYNEKTNPYNIDETKYWFYQNNEKLVAIMVEFDKYGGSYKNYNDVIKVLKDTYGNPSSENMKYNDKTYKDDPEKAFNYGYLTIETKWTNQSGFDIIVNWEKDHAYITYCKKGYKGII